MEENNNNAPPGTTTKTSSPSNLFSNPNNKDYAIVTLKELGNPNQVNLYPSLALTLDSCSYPETLTVVRPPRPLPRPRKTSPHCGIVVLSYVAVLAGGVGLRKGSVLVERCLS